MTLQPVLVDGAWRQPAQPCGTFQAVDPATKKPLPDVYPISGFEEVEACLKAAHEAVDKLDSFSPDSIAQFLVRCADLLESRGRALAETAHAETGLPIEPRLRTTELLRTTDQLRQAAAACRDRSWCRATLDTTKNIRSKHGPLGGPVVIFGPSNFPFAFNSAAGGDFAAAVASGNPVIAKANPGHPGTTKLLAEVALDGLKETGLPRATVQMLYHFSPEDGLKLAAHPLIGATAFTGSRTAGLRLKVAADRVGKPIYLEMSSLNPVFVLPGAMAERKEQIAQEIFASCTMGTGQFCTKPGLVILKDDDQSESFLGIVENLFETNPPGLLVGRQAIDTIQAALKKMTKLGARIVTGGRELPGPGYSFANTLLCVSGQQFLKHPQGLQVEAFGNVSLFVLFSHDAQLAEIAGQLDGNLTGTIYSHSRGHDDPLYEKIAPILRRKVGRLLNDKMPTGVAVTPAMNHGGPFPATGHPGFTSVGIPASLLRFTALHCYDNVRPGRLPEELRDKNPTGSMWRLINGEWTRRDVT